MLCGCWCYYQQHAAPLVQVVKALRRCCRRPLSLADQRLPTLVSAHFCPIGAAQCQSSEPGVCPLLLKCHLGSSGMCRSASTCEKPAGRAGAFIIFMRPFTRMERGSSDAFLVTGNETGFREICTADTPATEALLAHM